MVSLQSSGIKQVSVSDNEKEWKGSFTFIQGADTQYGMFSSYQNIGEGWQQEIDIVADGVKLINSLQPVPKFLVICGDLTDALPDDEKMIQCKSQQESDFLKSFSELKGMPLVCVSGNHDIGNKATENTILRYREIFGPDFFTFWSGGLMFIVLNSQYYFDGSLVQDLAAKQEEMLDAALAEYHQCKVKHRVGPVVFMHIPPFLKSMDETDSGYFALQPHIRKPFLDKLHDGGVRYVFCGHYHRNAGGFYKGMEIIVTSAIGYGLGQDKSGVRIVNVNEDGLNHKYFSFEDLPASSVLKN